MTMRASAKVNHNASSFDPIDCQWVQCAYHDHTWHGKDFGFYISEKNLITLFGTTIYFTMINDNVLLNDKDYWVKCDLESANLLKGFPDMLSHHQNHRMKLHV
mgnify:CR=1 FL=1